MSLANPWALLGMTTLVVPVIIHLLGRRQARLQKFPSVRFLPATRLMPARRTQLNDILILAVRLAIVAAATVALAQPRIRIVDRPATARKRLLTRAIIVDTSASMRRLTPSGETAIAEALRRAHQLSAAATTSAVVETAQPAFELDGASQWLHTQPGGRELVVLSDFQLGTVDSIDLGRVPTDIGLRLARIEVREGASTVQTWPGGRSGQISLTADRTIATWGGPQASLADSVNLVTLVGAAQRPLVEAARSAARATGGAPTANLNRRVALIYEGFDGRAAQFALAKPIDHPWMGDAIVRLHNDRTLLAAAAIDSARDTESVDTGRFSIVVRDGARRPLLLASRGTVGSGDGLQLWLLGDAGSLTSAALFMGLSRAMATTPPTSELEPNTIPATVLSAWERSAVAPTDTRSDHTDGRWLWVLALGLIGVEAYMRRSGRSESEATGGQPVEVRDVA